MGAELTKLATAAGVCIIAVLAAEPADEGGRVALAMLATVLAVGAPAALAA